MRATRAYFAGSIRRVLSTAFISQQDLVSLAGGFAASIAVGAFVGQSLSALWPTSDQERRRYIAVGGYFGLVLLIGLILVSGKWR